MMMMMMMMMMATAVRKSRGLIQLMGQYALPMMMTVMMVMVMMMVMTVVMVMVMMMMLIMKTMVTALRKSRGLIQLMVDGLLTLMENDDGRWN